MTTPWGVGMTGLLGWGDAYKAMHESDLIVMWGTDFPYFNFLPTKPAIVQIDRRGEVLGRRCRLDLGICGDVGAHGGRPAGNGGGEKGFRPPGRLPEASRQGCEGHECLHGRERQGIAHPPRTGDHRREQVRGSGRRVYRGHGTPCIWSARFLCSTLGRKTLASFNHGSMANAMPMAIGAQKAYPNRQVVALCGDGGLSMLLGDLITIAQYKLPVRP